MANNADQIKKDYKALKRFMTLIVVPVSLGLLIHTLIEMKIFWFSAFVFAISLLYFVFALLIDEENREIDIRIFGVWLSIRKSREE